MAIRDFCTCAILGFGKLKFRRSGKLLSYTSYVPIYLWPSGSKNSKKIIWGRGLPQQCDGRRSFKIILYEKRSESSSSKKRGNSMECHGCVVTHFISSYLFFPLLGQESREHVIDVDPGEAGD